MSFEWSGLSILQNLGGKTVFVPPVIEQGETFAQTFLTAFTFDPDGVNESVSAPTGNRDGIFGVTNHSEPTKNWRGLIRTTGAGDEAPLDFFCARVPSTDEVILLYSYNGAHNIIGSDDSTLASVSDPSPNSWNSLIVGISADGTSLSFGPKIYNFSASPAPPASAVVFSWGLNVTDDVISATLIWDYNTDTDPSVTPIANLAGDTTETMPSFKNISGSEYPSMLVNIILDTNGAFNSYTAAANDPSGMEVWFSSFSDNFWPGGVYDRPFRGDSGAGISPDGSFVVQPWKHIGGFSFNYPGNSGLPEFGRNTPSPVLVGTSSSNYWKGNGSGSHFHGGIYKTDADGYVDWVVTNTSDFDDNGGANRTWFNGTAVDSSGNIYAACSWLPNSTLSAVAKFDRWPTNYSGGTVNSTVNSNHLVMLLKINSSGDIQWIKYIQAGAAPGNSEQSYTQVHGLALSQDESKVYLTTRMTRTVQNQFRTIVDPGTTNWTPADNGVTSGRWSIGHMFLTAWDAGDGAFDKARLLTHNNDPFGTAAGSMWSGTQISINPYTGGVIFPIYLDVSGIGTFQNLAFFTDDGTTQTKVSAVPGVSLHTNGRSGQSDAEILYTMEWDPTTGTVTVIHRHGQGTVGWLDEQRMTQIRAVR